MTGERERPDRLGSPAKVAMELVESRVHERLFGAPTRSVTIGRFRVLGPAGAGGMGVVFAAHDPELGRRVAIKLVAQGLLRSSASSQARLLAEARTLAQLSHPNVVTVHDVGMFEGGIYVAMEYIDGDTLEQWVARGHHWTEIVAVFVQAGRGLAAGHAAGVIHRDFKPSNAMIDRAGQVRVLDFGLATEAGVRGDAPSSDRGRTSSRGGTFLYMAPELRGGGKASTRSDQYAFCVSLRRALSASADVPTWLRRAVQRGLAEDPSRRWPAMEPLLDALEKGEQRAHRRRRRAGAIAFVLIAAGIAWGMGGRERGGEPNGDCHGFVPDAARAWDADARQLVDRALVDAEDSLATTLVWHLDKHAEALREARGSACAASAGEAVQGRLQCLDRAEREFASTIQRLERSRPETLPAASMAVSGLDLPTACEAASFEPEEDPEVAQLLADANVSRRAGNLRDAYELLTLACARLSGRSESVQWARCHAMLGDALFTLGRYEEAGVELDQAYRAATTHDRASIGVRAAENAARTAMMLGRDEEARRWLGNLRADADRLEDPAAQVAVAVVEAELLASEHRYAEAIAIHDELDRTGLLERSTVSRQLSTRLRVARYRSRVGDAAGSERELAAAKELADGLPESHASVAATHALRGQHLQQLERFEEALEEYRITIELATRYRSSEDPMGADARGASAECLAQLGRLDEALAIANESVRRSELAHPNARVLLHDLLARGDIHRRLGNAEAAERDGVAALTRAQERRDGADIVAAAEGLLAKTSIALGKLDDARAHAERAVAGFERILGPEHAETRGARALLEDVTNRLATSQQ